VLYSTEKMIGLFMKSVIAKLALNPEKNQNAGGHTNRQPGYVNEGTAFMSSYLAEGDFDIAPYKGWHYSGGMPERMASLIELSFFVFLSQDVNRSGLFERRTKGSLLIKTSFDLIVDLISEMGFQLCDVRVLEILALPERSQPVSNLIFKIKHFYFLN
jgi:hypothetical protein